MCGKDFVVGTVMSVREYGDPLATTPEEGIDFAKMREKAGADYINASAYAILSRVENWQ